MYMLKVIFLLGNNEGPELLQGKLDIREAGICGDYLNTSYLENEIPSFQKSVSFL